MEVEKILVSTAAVAVTTSAFATDRYVSTNGVYGADVPGAVCYTDLQKAIDESANNDVVWVQDGFVCDEGENEAYTEWDKSKTKNRIAVVSKINLLVRSESGYVDEANGKGATIRGAYNSESEKCGAGSIRPILLHNQATLVGFVLENGSVNTNQPSVGGGGVWMYRSTLSNCVVRNCHATNGGGVFINQTLPGRGVFNTVVTNNTTTSYGGGVYGPADFRDCRIANNTASPTSSNSGCGGGAAGGAVLSKNFSDAPPPVEICVILFSRPSS